MKFKYRKSGDNIILPIMLQFNSEITNGKFHRIGDSNAIMNDAIYRVRTYNDFKLLTEDEKYELVKQNDLLAGVVIKSKSIEDVLEYCKIK